MAEGVKFEPSEHLLGAHTISNRAPSASRASLLWVYFIIVILTFSSGKALYSSAVIMQSRERLPGRPGRNCLPPGKSHNFC